MATRKEFLSDVDHRIRFVYLPKHSSWLNQIEIIFGIIHRKLLRSGNFTSIADLEEQLRQFMEYYNRTMAHPFAWTYTGKPMQKQRRALRRSASPNQTGQKPKARENEQLMQGGLRIAALVPQVGSSLAR